MTRAFEKELASLINTAKIVIDESKNSIDFSTVSLFSNGFINPSLLVNISVAEKHRVKKYFLFLSPRKIFVKPGFMQDAGFMIMGSTGAWLDVLRGEKTLISRTINSEMFLSNYRVNFSKLVLLSNIISICTNKRLENVV
ncbi:MAG TPA: hypothetical protein VKM55_10085 [Candidatus Lokiarchaeia archaeon]|nr:hypothetical protein [Candidatus Lokiarchaeia archaeon]